jgi:hypothetical protein
VRPRSAAALAVSAVLSTAATAPSAGAQTPLQHPALSTDYPCYGSGESAMLTGSGFTPQGVVTLSASGQQLTTIEADADGEFAVRIQTPGALFGTTRLSFTATDRAQPPHSDSATVRIADPDVLVTPDGVGPRQLRRVRAWGFFGSDSVYAHVKRRGATRAHNIRLGTPRGACGVLDVRRRLFPRDLRPGAYTLQFDTLPRYYPNLDSSVSYSVGVVGP